MPVVGITGRRRGGKDSVANILVEHHGYIKVELPAPLTEDLCILDPWCHVNPEWQDIPEWARFSDLVARLGIDEAKDASPDVRAYQQRYGTDVIRDRVDVDHWVLLAEKRMAALRAEGQWNFVLPNIRADNERDLCDIIIGVVRENHAPTTGGHKIEDEIDRLVNEADIIILNPDTPDWMAQLKDRIDPLVETFGP